MDDKELHTRIAKLVAEERELEEGHIGTRATPEQEHRLREVQIALDQAWDLLRQRRARREFDQDASTTSARAPEVVEGYEQ
ncbi:MAG: DUF2630 family protein [Acidimicrobiales bacterium]|jgi:hypothetical protein